MPQFFTLIITISSIGLLHADHRIEVTSPNFCTASFLPIEDLATVIDEAERIVSATYKNYHPVNKYTKQLNITFNTNIILKGTHRESLEFKAGPFSTERKSECPLKPNPRLKYLLFLRKLPHDLEFHYDDIKKPYYELLSKPLIASQAQVSKVKKLLKSKHSLQSTTAPPKTGCASLVPPENGNITCTGPKCVYKCSPGYKLTGFPSKICINEAWRPMKPVGCKLINTDLVQQRKQFRSCPILTPPANGFIDCKNGKCKYTCAEGYTVKGYPSKICVVKSWRPEKPVTCELKRSTLRSGCTKPVVDYAVVQCIAGGRRCDVTCKAGFKLLGTRSNRCVKKTWRHEMPICREIRPTSIPKEEEMIPAIKMVRDDVQLKMGLNIRKISFKNCPPLDMPKNGVVNCGKNKCKFACDDGFIMEGYHTKICMPSKTWRPVKPTRCVSPKNCK